MAEEGGSKKKVMVAIDESDCSHYALEWTLDFLQESISKSPFLIFAAQPVSNFTTISAATYGVGPIANLYASTAPELIKSIQDQQRKITSAVLEKAKEICASRGVIAETITEVGDPKELICEAVDKFNVNLLVLGSHGKGALKRAFLGSVSNYCAHNAKCPVLVVKEPA